MPPYGGPPSDLDEIEVSMCVVVQDTTYKSNSVKFFYLNHDKPQRKRRRISIEEDTKPRTYDRRLDNISRDHAMLTMPKLEKLNLDDKIVSQQSVVDKIYKKVTESKETDLGK